MKIKRIAVLAKMEDGKIRQIVFDKQYQILILNQIAMFSENQTIQILETELEGVEFINED